jgi:catechol 2,3-dioxygenase-like lactoylglutathione lyase family enzyme
MRHERMEREKRQRIGYVALVVRDYDEAIEYYTTALGFELVEDTALDDEKRWVLLAPPGSVETRLLLAKASTPQQAKRIGDQTGGRVFLFLHTDDFWRDYRQMIARGVKFCEAPRDESYGTVAVFEDLYGNRWDLLQLRS